MFITFSRINNIPNSIHRRFNFHSWELDAFPSKIDSKIQKTILILSFSRTASSPSTGPETMYWKFDLTNLILNLLLTALFYLSVCQKSRKQSLTRVAPAQLRLLLTGPETMYWKFDLSNLILKLTVKLRFFICQPECRIAIWSIFCHDDTVCSHFNQHRVRLIFLHRTLYNHSSEKFYGMSGVISHKISLIRPADHRSKRPYILQLFLFTATSSRIINSRLW